MYRITNTGSFCLYERHVNDLFNYGIGMGFSEQICMDAIHDVFCNLYVNKKCEEILNIKYYLFSSLKNRLIDIYRSSSKLSTFDIESLPFAVEVSILDTIIADDEQAILRASVEKLMASLTNRQREAIYLRYMQELSYEEIGILLDMTPESVRKLVHRGIEKMRDKAKSSSLLLILSLLFPL
ncbi:MAG: sigma-70 family RNA polymerase sigma factor [Dysgonamonadaceae bacterium]|nr:sigma-70 family RNA polymerase sigma factor [Dysgonamonadaceae bacterium]